MERWHRKVAVVTGASVGIGAAIVQDLLSNGLQVIGLARRLDTLKESKTKLSPDLQKSYTTLQCDVGDKKCVDSVFDKIIEEFGGVDILVNSAAVMNCGSLLANDVCQMQQMLQINIMGIVHCTKRAFESMRTRNLNGHIIVLNSIVGHSIPCLDTTLPPMVGGYVTTKCALTAITEMYRQELIHFKTKIKITSISPGITDTDMVQDWLRTASGENMLHPKDVSSAVIYAISTPPHVQIHEIVVKPVGEFVS